MHPVWLRCSSVIQLHTNDDLLLGRPDFSIAETKNPVTVSYACGFRRLPGNDAHRDRY